VEAGNTGRTEQCWLDLENAYLSALFSHASTLPAPTPLSAYHLFTRQSSEALLEQLLASPCAAAREQAIIFEQTSERMRGSIVPVVAAKLQFLRDPQVAHFCSASHFAPDFGRLRREPFALYWCLRESDIARLRPLTSVFFSLLLDQIGAVDLAEHEEQQTPVLLLLDEFANIGVIPHFETTIALARGRGVSLWLGIQSLAQLEARYGRANAQTILTNCATKVALHGLDVDSAEYFSRALGEATRVTRKRARHRRWLNPHPASTTDSSGEHKRALLTADEVRRIGTDEAIVITGNRRPLLLPKFFYDAPPNPAATSPLGQASAALPLSLAAPVAPHSPRAEPPPLPPDLLLPLLRHRPGVAGAEEA
jgi:type IV secretion system protein VirD4